MSIQSEINRIKTDKESLITTLKEKGMEIADGATLGDISINIKENLPEAGGSGGEIKTVTLATPLSCNYDVVYMDISGNIVNIKGDKLSSGTTVEFKILNSHIFYYIFYYDIHGVTISGGSYEHLDTKLGGATNSGVLKVNGDITITVNYGGSGSGGGL